MTINLRLKFRKKTVVLPIYSFDKNTFKILIPVYNDNGDVIDITQINLPIQVVANPSPRLYKFLRMRGVV